MSRPITTDEEECDEDKDNINANDLDYCSKRNGYRMLYYKNH